MLQPATASSVAVAALLLPAAVLSMLLLQLSLTITM